MARKRKSVASTADLCPRDLNEIPYIAWMNKQIAAGRKPAGPLPEGAPGAGDTSFEAPRDVPTRGRRDADRVASSRVNDDAAFDDDAADSDYNECDEACDDDADSGEEEDKGMSPSEDEVDADEDADDDDDASEEAQPATPAPRRSRASAAARTKTAAKGGEPPCAAAKTRNLHPVKRSVCPPRENTIFVAARWFMKDELGPLLGKQGSQYWARLVRHLEQENPGWVRGVNALQKQWRNLVNMYKQIKKGEKASGKGAMCKPHWYSYMALFQNNKAVGNPHAVDGGGAAHVNVPCGFAVPSTSAPCTSTPTFTETATMTAAKLVCETIKGCHSDAMNRLEGLVRAWMEQDARIARERVQQPAPSPPARDDIPMHADNMTATHGRRGTTPLTLMRARRCGFAAPPSEVGRLQSLAQPLAPFPQILLRARVTWLPLELCYRATSPPWVPVSGQVCPQCIDAPNCAHRFTHVVQDDTTRRPCKNAPELAVIPARE
ncbi:unnamed protein product [Closterium sp. Naga37s-1]|nr:unnamed protein product [Closterium sp. Naga37s-1]